ncbi:MAG TPA: sigma-70 family RNA polymerase sigma factor [Casimicrobiaceae bacterium]|nr:sigma-70 family RNA polymerase sigma factor [Casimicrobiaceae bacterium]
MGACLNESPVDIFESHRSRLFGVAYRMLKAHADADDVVQDVYLRWHATPSKDIESPLGFLITVTTRCCLDRLRHRSKERDGCTEYCVPEAHEEDCVPSPEQQCETAEEVSAAFVAVVERLGPDERAAFLLREVFDYDYADVAGALSKSEPACRQLVHRAHRRLRAARARFAVTPQCRQRVLGKLFAATATCDHHAVMALLAQQIEYVRPASRLGTLVSPLRA